MIEEPRAVAEIARLELRKLVLISETTQRDIENKYGCRKGYLSQVLNGTITLTVWHVFTILDGLNIPAESFFAHVEDCRREVAERLEAETDPSH